MKCSLGISDFLEEISSLSCSIVFLYFFALITEEGFLISPSLLWNSAFKWVYLYFSPLLFTSRLFIAICKASSDSHLLFCISFPWRWYFAPKVHIVKAVVFPVVMYGCESWTIKKAEHSRIDAFELWCWRRLLRVPWAAWRSI